MNQVDPEEILDQEHPPPPLTIGSLRLDLACGGGVFPGDVVEISGPEGSGKTALCLQIAAAAQRAGSTCAWIDVDWAFDPAFARGFGIPTRGSPALALARPVDAEMALDILRILASAGIRLLILDSLSALVSRKELEDLRDSEEFVEEKLLSLAMRAVAPRLMQSGTSLIFTRQSRTGAGSPISDAYHQLNRRLNRLALNLRSSLILRLDSAHPISVQGDTIGQRVLARVMRPYGLPPYPHHKNNNLIKISPCSQRVDFDIMYKQGFIRTGEVFDLGVETGVILVREGRYIYQNQDLGFGRAASIQEINRKALTRQMEQVIRQEMLRNVPD